ncbi:mitotic fidelity of chromosome transmission- protein [Ophidiomyces ophidiicola]|nr:mitotic fidelity of chromosome transmission- protein [Ophidiomyces ophidiicola]
MAARRLPPKTREMDFGNVGVAGRRTGVTLEKGKIDEHGMEEIDGMFSSPEKSPVGASANGFGNDTTVQSEDMETGGSSSIPEPADMLTARRNARDRFVLPPRSRSPIKTFLSGSPRRTPGIRSSPIPQSDQISSPSSRTVAKRTLNFSKTQDQHSNSPLKHIRSTSATLHVGSPESREHPEEMNIHLEDQTADFSDDGSHLAEEAEEELFVEAHGDYHESSGQNGHDQYANIDTNDSEESLDQGNNSEVQPSPVVVVKATGRGRKRNEARVESEEIIPKENSVAPKKRGRKPGATREEFADVKEYVEPSRPAKRTKTDTSKVNTAGLQMSVEQEKELNQVINNITKRDGPLRQRSLHILKKETPSDDTVRHTRSGRPSVRPLAFWRNEKCVYGTGDTEVGQRFPLSTIKEIIRIDDPEPVFIRSKKKSSKKKSKLKTERTESSDDEAEDVEPWETDGGVFYGPVHVWDSELQAGTQEEEIMDIAYAPLAIQTQEVKGSSFRFAKILSTPFLGSGFVEMPPGAVKKQKNSKRMHMVFFVYRGRIRVNVSGLEFSAGKGCVFQVPRGNNYSFENDYGTPAAIFFTQGCIPLDEEGNVDTGAPAPPLLDPSQQPPQENQEQQEQNEQPAEIAQAKGQKGSAKPEKKKRGRAKRNA